MGEREVADAGSERDGAEQQGATEVGADQERTTAAAIHPHAGEEAEEEVGELAGDAEEGHLDGGCAEDEDGGEGQRQASDLGAGVGDDLGEPEG